jgi:GNAT superfamily N-acetyltransferase
VPAPPPGLHFEIADPATEPATRLLSAMTEELNTVYETDDRLDLPALDRRELSPPGGAYLVGWLYDEGVAGGGLRRLGPGLVEIKRMYVRPDWRRRGIAAALLAALEATARDLGYERVRLDTGPRQPHAQRLYRASGYVDIPSYNDNPYASYWGEKDLAPPP